MNIHYIINARMPTEKAHGYQIAKMCEAFTAEGAQVSLMIPTRKNAIQEDVFSYYSVRNDFSVRYISTLDVLTLFRGVRLGFYLQAISFLWALHRVDIPHNVVIITRNPEIVWWYGRRGYRVFYDAHNFPMRGGWFLKLLLRNVQGTIANSNGTADAFRGAGLSNILIMPNAVDLAQFTGEVENRQDLGLPPGNIAMYVGHLYEWKGVDVVVEAARRSTGKNLTFVFIGGTDSDLVRYRAMTKDLSNVVFLGRRRHNEVPALIKAANTLLLPNVSSTEESTRYTSPIKMFEYMASGVPIVASDLPSIKEILNDRNAVLVKAGDASDLLRGITQALLDDKNERGVQAKKDVQQYTWRVRAKKILEFLNKRK